MGSNNYGAPFCFTQPPPNYNVNNTWNYNWPSHPGPNRSTPDIKYTLPPLPPGPPPPPPVPPPPSTARPPPPPATTTVRPPPTPPTNVRLQPQPLPVSTPDADHRAQGYYKNSSAQGTYRRKRYIFIDISSPAGGQFSATGQYAASAGYPSPAPYSCNSPSVYNMPNSNHPNYGRNFYSKRKGDVESDSKKSNKKRKKPLSQNIPQRKDWSVMDAKRALTIEKEYNKRHRNQSLIIKFPDLELNRDIVSQFHSSIDSVHFQQPSTPRFCFVTLKDSADPESVIKEINKIPFGQGYLVAEYKKDREDEINIGPEDIDPLTLYVGNLAQEVTKEHMVNTYPKQKRIDIGYAKKMKYTRYAFVSFKNVDDSIEAFCKTHATQMYSKSLIVRFRRLNGTVGMPGEPKPQMPQRNESVHEFQLNSINGHNNSDHNGVDNHNHSSDFESENCSTPNTAPWEMVDVSQWESDLSVSTDMSSVKQEPLDDSDYEEEEVKPTVRPYHSPFLPGDLNLALSMHKPKTMPETKKEKDGEEGFLSDSMVDENGDLAMTKSKQTGHVSLSQNINDGGGRQRTISVNSNNSDCVIIPPEKIKTEDAIKKEPDITTGTNMYNVLRYLHPRPVSGDNIPVEVKKEPPATVEVNDKSKDRDVPTTLTIKDEPADRDDETNYGDEDDSSGDSDFNFNHILSSIEARTKRLKKTVKK